MKCEVRPLSVTPPPHHHHRTHNTLVQNPTCTHVMGRAQLHTCTVDYQMQKCIPEYLYTKIIIVCSLFIHRICGFFFYWPCFLLNVVVLMQHPTKSQPVGQYSKGHAPPCQSPAVTEHHTHLVIITTPPVPSVLYGLAGVSLATARPAGLDHLLCTNRSDRLHRYCLWARLIELPWVDLMQSSSTELIGQGRTVYDWSWLYFGDSKRYFIIVICSFQNYISGAKGEFYDLTTSGLFLTRSRQSQKHLYKPYLTYVLKQK